MLNLKNLLRQALVLLCLFSYSCQSLQEQALADDGIAEVVKASSEDVRIALATLGRRDYMGPMDLGPVNTQEQNKLSTLNISPNPTTGDCLLQFDLAKQANISAFLLDAQGKRIKPILDQSNLSAGNHQLFWDLNHFPVGVYFLNLEVSADGINQSSIEKIIKSY